MGMQSFLHAGIRPLGEMYISGKGGDRGYAGNQAACAAVYTSR